MTRSRAPRRSGRRPAAQGDSREAILRAARALFAERGFRGTTTRAIAERAGVDVALLGYFFASKARLFGATVEVPVSAAAMQDVLTDGQRRGERMARFHLDQLFVERHEAIAAMLRAALGDPDCIPALRSIIDKQLVAGAARALSGPDARLRAELAGALMVGLFVCRHMVRVEPLASASTEAVVSHAGRMLDQILDPARPSARRPAGKTRRPRAPQAS